jgi:hypothetical protein
VRFERACEQLPTAHSQAPKTLIDLSSVLADHGHDDPAAGFRFADHRP